MVLTSPLCRSLSTAISIAFSFTLITGRGGSSGGDSTSAPTTLPPPPAQYSYSVPAATNDGWEVADARELGIDVTRWESNVQNIIDDVDQFHFVDSILIAKNNQLLLEQNFRYALDFTDGWANNNDVRLHVINSVTKSVVSALIGIAIDQGHIIDENVLVHDYFRHKQPIANWSNDKANITLKNWLTMRHGYEWNEWNVNYLDSSNLNSRMNNSADPIQFLLDRPMNATPGETFAYSTGVSFGLGRLLEHATGQSVTQFMESNLFGPLGINNYTFWALDGQLHTGSALYLSTRDLAKFGQLFLDEGRWQDEQVISESWVLQSTSPHYQGDTFNYGYQWWLTDFNVNGVMVNSIYAAGFGGQYIFLFQELDAMVVFTGDTYQDEEASQRSYRTMLENYILPQLMN